MLVRQNKIIATGYLDGVFLLGVTQYRQPHTTPVSQEVGKIALAILQFGGGGRLRQTGHRNRNRRRLDPRDHRANRLGPNRVVRLPKTSTEM